MTNKTSLNLRRLAKDSLLNLFRQIGTVAFGFFNVIIIARGLGPDDRGVYAIAILFITVMALLYNGGIGAASVYYLAKDEHSLKVIIQGNLLLSVISSILGVAVGFLIVQAGHMILFPSIPVEVLVFSLLLIPSMLLRDNLLNIFMGLRDFRAFNAIGIITPIVTTLLSGVLVLWLRTGVNGALLAVLIANGLTLAATGLLLRDRMRNAPSDDKLTRHHLRQLLGYGLRGNLGNMIQFLNYRADTFLLNLFTNNAAVGIYDLAVSLGERLWTVASAVSMIIFPQIASAREDEYQLRHLTPLVSRYLLWLSLIVGLVIYILADWGIVLIFGEEFHDAAIALRLLMPGLVAGAMSKVIANDIAGRGRPEINTIQATFASAINIVVNLILIPRLSFIGAGIATSISYIVLTILVTMAFCRISGAHWRELIVPTRADLYYIRQMLRLIQARFVRQTST